MACRNMGKDIWLGLRNLMVFVSKPQKDYTWVLFLLFLSICNKTHLIVSFLKYKCRGHNCHLLLITSWLFSLWICFKSILILSGLQRCLHLHCCQLLHVLLSHILLSLRNFFLSEVSWLILRHSLRINLNILETKNITWRVSSLLCLITATFSAWVSCGREADICPLVHITFFTSLNNNIKEAVKFLTHCSKNSLEDSGHR